MSKITGNISNSFVREPLNAALINSVTVFTLGTTFGLITGNNIRESLRYGAGGAATGLVTGIMSGLSKAIVDSRALIHYTNEKGYNNIMETESLNASVGLKNARYGEGQYLTNLESKNLTPGQLSRRLYGVPWNTSKLKHYIKIDVSGLNVVQNNPYNYFIPGEKPLNLHGRIVDSGITVFKSKF